MHVSSLENMTKCRERFFDGTTLAEQAEVTVLDIGGADVNGSYRRLFVAPNVRYLAADLTKGPRVDIVLEDPYKLPLPDASVDVVLSGQTFEHSEFFWLAFSEMVRVTTATGLIFLIAPSAGPIHRFPVDCYRFYPDSFRALARYAGCHLLDVWHDERGPWQDVVGVFSKSPTAPAKNSPVPPRLAPVIASQNPEEETTRGEASNVDVLKLVHEVLRPSFYLEIGVGSGARLSLAKSGALGVDPWPDPGLILPQSASLVEMTSDEFFDRSQDGLKETPPNLILLDGTHLFECALRDFMNVERRAAPGALVVIDGVFPNHSVQALRERQSAVWMGDVWRMIPCLKGERPDLFLLPLDTSPGGLLLVAGLNPANRILWQRYNGLFQRYRVKNNYLPPEILAREGAMSPRDPFMTEMLILLRELRNAKSRPGVIVAALRTARAAGNAVS